MSDSNKTLGSPALPAGSAMLPTPAIRYETGAGAIQYNTGAGVIRDNTNTGGRG